jgi:hypothetical protein
VNALPSPAAQLSEADRYVIEHYRSRDLKEMAVELGCKWQAVQHRVEKLIRRGELRREQRAYRPPWTRADLMKLEAMIAAGRTDRTIAATLGRSPVAVNIARTRRGIEPRRKMLLSGQQVRRRLGLGCAKTVSRWIRSGWLRGRHGIAAVRLRAAVAVLAEDAA